MYVYANFTLTHNENALCKALFGANDSNKHMQRHKPGYSKDGGDLRRHQKMLLNDDVEETSFAQLIKTTRRTTKKPVNFARYNLRLQSSC
jgi:hypothetical protein